MTVVGVSMSGATDVRRATVAVIPDCPPEMTATDDTPGAGDGRGASAYAIAFPRGTHVLDFRPDSLRRRRAADRYTEDGARLADRPGG
jgi:hypothetical protein